jgi:hypothetical protein
MPAASYLASCEMKLSCLNQTYQRVLTQCHELFFAVETIAPAPQLRSSGIDQKK